MSTDTEKATGGLAQVLAALVRRGGGFTASVAVLALVSFGSVPLVLSISGAKAWTGIAVGQSVGTVCATVALFGWGVLGPATVAVMPPELRVQYYMDSVVSRVFLSLLLLPAFVCAVLLISPTHTNALVDLGAGGTVFLTSLSGSWYFIGEGSPRRLFLYDTTPRALGSVIGLLLLLEFRVLVMFITCQMLGQVLAGILPVRALGRRNDATLASAVPGTIRRLRQNSAGITTSIASLAYVQVPMMLVSAMRMDDISVYALGDKLQKFAVALLTPVVQVAQGTVPSPDAKVVRRRARVAALSGAGFALLAAATFAVAVPLLSPAISAGKIHVGFMLSIPQGIVLGCIMTSGVIGLAALVALGRARDVARSTVAGACVGLPLIVIAGALFGVQGVAWAVATAEAVVAGWQLIVLKRAMRDGEQDAGAALQIPSQGSVRP